MTVKLAIIGAGIMGSDHAAIFANELAESKVVLICDTDLAKARALAENCGIQDTTDDPEQAIARNDVDAVVIASPDFTHAEYCMHCLDQQKPVLCEKPLSPSSSECLSVLNAEMKTGRQWVQLGFMRRYDQSYIEMQAALKSGTIGEALMMHNFHRNVETPSTGFTEAMAITNSAPHEFDIARHVLETDFTTITAFQAERSDGNIAPVIMVLETANNQLVTIEINNNAAYGYDVRGELVGASGSVSLSAPQYSQLNIDHQQLSRYASDWRPRYASAYREQNRAFIEFVQTGKFPELAADCWDGYCAAIAAEAGVEALRTCSKVNITMIDNPKSE
ncbi:MAG: Gfo/Idh/MocA family oxidoreductase [Granulosicoccus sp.]|nr:Gfo/Idh/MocA family oxidoreductase [Granulosicoccus sp.]